MSAPITNATELPVAADKVRQHLRLVLAHGEFAASPQLSAFLNYIVTQKLAGANDRIKAYSIATEALGRPASFDAQTDPIVRVQAGRLRHALQVYYADPSADDSIRIKLPVGSYVPEIKATGLPHGPTQAVPRPSRLPPRMTLVALGIATIALLTALLASLPVIRETWIQLTWQKPEPEANPLGMPALAVSIASERQIPSWFSPGLFQRGLELDLARFDEFVVLSPPQGYAAAQDSYRLDLEFTGAASAVIGTVRLMQGAGGRIVWTNRFTVPEDSIDSYELIEPVRRLASTLGQPYGVLYAQLLGDPAKTEEQKCLLRGYEWFQSPSKEAIEPARQCLDQLLVTNPGNHIAHILLGYLYAERYRNNIGSRPAADLAHAFTLAKRAVALRPESAGSYQVMMEVQSLRGLNDLALEAGKKAVNLNPNDSDVLADYGCRLIFRGRYSEGGTYAERAARWNPVRPPWHEFCLFVAANNTAHFQDAEAVAQRLDGEAGPSALVPVAIAAWRRGDQARADRAVHDLLDYDATYASEPEKSLALIGLFPDAAGQLAADLRSARLKSAK
jgi:tetratricopeptide (TPR) repeat protein